MDKTSLITRPVRGVLFDAGNTLIRVRNSVGAVYAEVATRYGAKADPACLDLSFHEVFEQHRGSFLAGVSRPHSPARERAWWRDVVVDVFRDTAAGESLATSFDQFFEELYAEFALPKHWELFPDVVPCLEQLDRLNLPFAVVSNWDSRLHPVLQGLKLGQRLRFVLTSAEFGAEKPDPTIFLTGASRLGLPPEQVLHVGDSLVDDVQGAQAAGLGALWLRRGSSEPCPTGVACIRDLRSLADRFFRGPGTP